MPGAGDLAAHRFEQRLALGAGEVGAIEAAQGGGNPVVFVLQRAAHDFGRMRGHHELDAQPADGVVQRLGRHARREEARQHLFDGSLLGPALWIALTLAAPPHAVVLFGDVREVQEMREAAGDRQRGLHRHLAQFAGELLEIVGRAGRTGAPPLRQRADALDTVEVRVALVAAQRLAQQLAEEPDVVAQRLVRIVAHQGPGKIAKRRKIADGKITRHSCRTSTLIPPSSAPKAI